MLDAVYDLLETNQLAAGSHDKLPAKDDLLARESGVKVSGLLFIRGEKHNPHQLCLA